MSEVTQALTPGQHTFKRGQRVLIPLKTGVRGLPVCESSTGHDVRSVEMWRSTDDEDRRKWEESEHSKGLDCAGESRLMSPTVQRTRPSGDLVFVVVRARCSAPRGWRKQPKCVEVIDDEGTQWFVSRAKVFPLS